MKARKCFWSAAAACVVLLAALVCCCSCDRPLPSPNTPVPVYDLDITFDGENTILLREELLFTNRTGESLSDLSLRLYANAYAEGGVCCLPEEKEDVYYNGESFGGIEVYNVEIDGSSAESEISADGGILSVACRLDEGDTATLTLNARITLPECNARFGVTQSGTVNLTAFYPVLCAHRNGEWREDAYAPVGDPFLSDISSFYVTLDAPAEYVAAASGEVTSSSLRGTERHTEITAENVRDFALFLSPDFEVYVTSAQADGEDVRVAYYHTGDGNAARTARLAADALEFFSSEFGAYPYPSFTLVTAEVGAGGMEYGALAAVDPSVTDEQERAITVVHETAHQWWFGVVGSDQLNAPWQDEGLTEFSAIFFFLSRGDEDVYRSSVVSAKACLASYLALPTEIGFDPNMRRHLSTYVSVGEYVAVTYCKGLLLFDALYALVGDDGMSEALTVYFSENAFSVADAEDIISAFTAVHSGAAAVFGEYLG